MVKDNGITWNEAEWIDEDCENKYGCNPNKFPVEDATQLTDRMKNFLFCCPK